MKVCSGAWVFSINAMTFYSQLPSLRGGIPGVNPFVGETIPPQGCPPAMPVSEGVWSPAFEPCPAFGFNPFDPSDRFRVERVRPYVPAFDIHFPRVTMVGASLTFTWTRLNRRSGWRWPIPAVRNLPIRRNPVCFRIQRNPLGHRLGPAHLYPLVEPEPDVPVVRADFWSAYS